MNKIGENQCKDILSSFAWDSTGYEESSGIRAREREDSHIWYFRDWFNIVTDRGLREGRCFRIYQNSFSEKRNKFDEDGEVSLCAKVRNMFECSTLDPNKKITRLISNMFNPTSPTGLIALMSKMLSNQQHYVNNGGAIAIDRVHNLNEDDYFHL